MKKLAITVLGICGLLFAIIQLTPLSKIDGFSYQVLEEEVRMIEMELYPMMSEPEPSFDTIKGLESELFWLRMEIARQKYKVNYILLLIALMAMGVLVYRTLADRNKKQKAFVFKELTPTEKYIVEFDFENARISGFPTKEDAIEWLGRDKLRLCEYCGGVNKAAPDAEPDRIQFCTFYKIVPEGSKDLRIVLGSVWNVMPAEKLVCSSCARSVSRV